MQLLGLTSQATTLPHLENPLLWVSLALTVLILIFTVIITLATTAPKRKIAKEAKAICDAIQPQEHLLMTNFEAIASSATHISPSTLAPLLQRYFTDSQKNFKGEWLLNPQSYVCKNAPEIIATARNNTSLIAFLSLTGFIGSVALGIAHLFLDIPLTALLILVPFASGLLAATFFTICHRQSTESLDQNLTLLGHTIATQVPVFSEKDGVGALVAQMIKYDYKVSDTLLSFDETIKRFVECDLSKGIAETIRTIMEQQIAPPIKEATTTLTELATTLSQRQETGMERLAAQFTDSVVKQLQSELEPMHQQMSAFTKLVGHACQYTQTMLEALERTENEQIFVKNEIAQSLEELAKSKHQIANEMAQLGVSIEHINKSTHKMTALYNHEEIGLTSKIEQMANSLDQYAKVLATSVGESAKALAMASQLTDAQQKSANEFQNQMAQEIDTLREIQRVLDVSVTAFTDESSAYLNRTLKSFDNALGEIVERLTYTATEIRDAVETLPTAIDALHNKQN